MIYDKYKYDIDLDLSNKNSSHNKIIEKIEPNSKVLEFGPASGQITKYLKLNKNCYIVCCEIDPHLAMITKSFCDKMINEDIELININEVFDEKFDYIIFGDVLEHLKDPWKVIYRCKDLLKIKGQIISSIPNISYYGIILSLLQSRFNYVSSGILDKTHLRFFTRDSAIQLFEDNGYCITNIDHVLLNLEESEFNESLKLEHFPKLIINYLVLNKDYKTYQFIITAKIKEENDDEILEVKERNILERERELFQKEDKINKILTSSSYNLALKVIKIRKIIKKYFF